MCSGLTWEKLLPCVNWMAPYAETVAGYMSVPLKQFETVSEEDWHNIQTHTTYLTMLVSADIDINIRTRGWTK